MADWTAWNVEPQSSRAIRSSRSRPRANPAVWMALSRGGGAGGQLGDQVGQRDVEEVASRKRHQHGHLDLGGQGVGDHRADQDGRGRGQVVGQGGPPLPAAVDQDAEVAQLLGDLVGGGDQPGDHAQAGVGDERGADGQPADEVVEGVGDQDQVAERPMGAQRPVAVVLASVFHERFVWRCRGSASALLSWENAAV
jgi:hypothetical protein